MKTHQILLTLYVVLITSQVALGSTKQPKKRGGATSSTAATSAINTEAQPITTHDELEDRSQHIFVAPKEETPRPKIHDVNVPTSLTQNKSQRRFVEPTDHDSPQSTSPTHQQAQSQSFTMPTTQLTTAEIQKLSALLPEERQEWDDANPDGPASTQPKPQTPSYWDKIMAVPHSWWEVHVSEKNRVERLMIFCGLTTTYTLLLEKIQSGEYSCFIEDLNREHQEGTRWLDAALHETVDAGLEGPTRKLLTQSIQFIPALPQTTHKKLTSFLSALSDRKRKALQEDLREYTQDQESLANLARQIDAQQVQKLPASDHIDFATKTTLASTQFGSQDLFPRAIEQKRPL